jgi:hypothetical protein
MARNVYKHCLPSVSHAKLRMFMSCIGVFKVFKGEGKVNDAILGAIEIERRGCTLLHTYVP